MRALVVVLAHNHNLGIIPKGLYRSWLLRLRTPRRKQLSGETARAGSQIGTTGRDLGRHRVYRVFAGTQLWATAAFTSVLNAPASTFSPS